MTIFPGQHIRCGICGRLCYWGCHLGVKFMVCSGVRDYVCWNAVNFDGILAGQRILESVFAKLEELPDFDEAFMAQVHETEAVLRASRPTELAASEVRSLRPRDLVKHGPDEDRDSRQGRQGS